MGEKRSEFFESNQNQLEGFYKNLQDVVIEQAQKALNYDLYIKALLSTLPVAVIATEKDGLIRTVNKAAEEILGIKAKQIRGRELSDVFRSNPELIDKTRQTLQEGSQFHMGTENLSLSANKQVVVNIYIQPIWDEGKDICGLLLTIEDQTYVNFLQDAFKRYVPPSVSEIIAKDPQQLKLGGEERNLTVLFSDLVGFTTICEKSTPKEIVTLLSEYFGEMTSLIFDNEGTLKEYVGDELMAIFGAPVYHSDHARRACKSAVAMSRRLKEVREIWNNLNRPELRARIGINTGSMLVGNLGSKYRFSYGVVGDQVNLASRLEGLSNTYGTEILIGENTAKEIGDDFHIRKIDLVRVKGRNQPVAIFELIDEANNPLSDATRKLIDNYSKGLSSYKDRKWGEALKNFQIIKDDIPEDGPTEIMIERCRLYRENPPPDNWDGVFEHVTK
jgi:PAS domain S-box-containing protein